LVLNKQNALHLPVKNIITSESGGGIYGTRFTPIKINEFLFIIITYASASQQRLFFMPNMLITINNLTQPIVKSSEQTMKVTYTIVEEGYGD
jgi:hypothetical protein